MKIVLLFKNYSLERMYFFLFFQGKIGIFRKLAICEGTSQSKKANQSNCLMFDVPPNLEVAEEDKIGVRAAT